MNQVSKQENIAIIGAGICGLCTALALTRAGHQVTIYERDVPPPDGGADEAFFEWKRRGAAQFRHPHAFLSLMCNILQDNYPDLMEAFWQAGARKVTFEDMLPDELQASYRPEPGDERLWLLMCRRATIETVLRRYAEQQPGISINNSANVIGIEAENVDGVIHMQGIRVRQDGEDAIHEADFFVDAGGRTSRFTEWFSSFGAEIEIEDDDAEIVYYTRHYQLAPGVEEPPRRGKDRSAGDLGYIKFGVFPGEDGHFAIILCVPDDEPELREAVKDPDRFDAICRSIPGLKPWVGEGMAIPTTSSFGFGDIHAVWRHFVRDGKPVALNYFAVGDASVRTNPLYGRGCSIGIMHAHLLADLINEVQDPWERALAYDRLTEEEIRPIFKASLSEDRKGIQRALAIREGRVLDQADSFKSWLGLAFGDAMAAASRDQLHVIRGVMRTFNLMEKPGEFLNDWRIRMTLFRYMFKGRTQNARARIVNGPHREEMLALIQSN
ncbi:MAG: FAD-dependent monooxygenase [Pseudomonadales bacterium]|nr:FAD-dependent monooxygenase [Pseudomonadales bacterium]